MIKLVFRKPYAFLIKHFKIVHLILTLIYIYLALKVNGILKYYNNFISGTESKLNAINYVNNFYILAIVASIIICLIIYALMRYKKKPKLLYVILIVLYLTTAIIINISLNGLNTIYIDVLDVKTQRVYRDLLQIIIIFQYISICFTTVRALGFDIKKFNFQEDIFDQDSVLKAYIELSELYNWDSIDCVSNNKMKSVEEIHEEIMKIVRINLNN